nr:hypothetical protein [Enterocloster clostridioformis]
MGEEKYGMPVAFNIVQAAIQGDVIGMKTGRGNFTIMEDRMPRF